MGRSRNKAIVNYTKRDALPRKVKEQSAINLENLAVIMEIIEASSAVEDSNLKKAANIHKKRTRLKKASKYKSHSNVKNHLKNQKGSSSSAVKNPHLQEYNCNSKTSIKTTEPSRSLTLPKAPGLLHFMELGERTDLLCNTSAVDPLGPDSFDNFQWVDVKQELPDNVELCKVTITELPLKLDENHDSYEPFLPVELTPLTADAEPTVVPVTADSKPPIPPGDEVNKKDSFSEDVLFDNKSWDQFSSCDDSYFNSQDSENIKVNLTKRKIKKLTQVCDLCGKKLCSKGSLRLHKLRKHHEKIQFSCELCNLKFDFQRKLVKHRNSVHRQEDGRFSCQVCLKSFSDYHSFLPHIKIHLDNCKEKEDSDKICQECQKTFQNEESLRIHQTLTHTIDEKGLRDKLKNQEKNFTCHTCGKRFAFNCLLRDHINLHTGTKPYLCQECGKAFSQKATLKQHAKTHNEIRPFQCPECPLGFYGAGDLKKHVRKHTGERPYVCEVCGEGFSRSGHLLVHRRSHTGERPHICDVCGRGFTKRGDVVRHRRIHTGELPYLCQACGKAFRQSTQCANHIKSQHPDVPVIVAKNPNPLYPPIPFDLAN